MRQRSKNLLWISALAVPWLAFPLASSETVDVEYSNQDNVSFVGASDSEVEHLIRLFGLESPWAGAAPRDGDGNGIPLQLHTVADRIIGLYQEKLYADLIELLKENPDVRAARPEVNQLEAWSYYHSGQARVAMKLFQDLYIKTPSASHAVGVIYSGMRADYYKQTYQFADTHGGPLADILKPGEKAPVGEPEDAIEKTRLDFLNAWLRATIRFGKFTAADEVARLLGLEDANDIKAEMLIGYGWQAHKAEDFDKAAGYFRRAANLDSTADQDTEARYGHALSLRDAGNLTGSMAVIKSAAHPDERMLSLLSEIALHSGRIAYDAKDYSGSLDLARSMKSAKNEPRAAWLLEGWSLLNLDRNEEAANVFVSAYRKSPDQESADGVTASLLALGRRDDIVSLSEEIAGPLQVPAQEAGGVYVMSDGERAYYRGDFALATAFKPELAETLVPWFGVTFSYKSRDGDAGLGRLNLSGSKASYDRTDDTGHLRAEFEVLYADAEGPPSNPLLSGSRATGGVRPFTPTFDDTLFQPSISFRKEGIWGTQASLGLSPMAGEVNPTLTGHFDVVRSRSGAKYSAGIHRMSIYESLLSISGMKDTVTGTSWGRVVETGLHADLYHPLGNAFAISAEGKLGKRSGRQVDTNQTRFFNLGLNYSFSPNGFSYVAVGPSFKYMSFDKNRSFFTFGHGGYYSPAEVHAVSLNLNFMTEEDRDWIARGSLSAGYEEAENDAAPFYPLDPLPGDPVYQATSSQGMALTFEGAAARRVSDSVIAELGAYGINTEDYSEAGAFVKLRVNFGKRSKVWRTDLTEDLHRRYH